MDWEKKSVRGTVTHDFVFCLTRLFFRRSCLFLFPFLFPLPAQEFDQRGFRFTRLGYVRLLAALDSSRSG